MKHLFLCGFPRTGKTSLGKRLAQDLKVPFLDTDREIEKAYQILHGKIFHAGYSCREIFHKEGEPFFRSLEEIVLSSLSHKERSIVALGGGAVFHHYPVLKNGGFFIYLEREKAVLKKLLLTPPLPAFLDPLDPLRSFEELYEKRLSFYEAIPAERVKIREGLEDEALAQAKSFIKKVFIEKPVH
jgi:shikimate kinase